MSLKYRYRKRYAKSLYFMKKMYIYIYINMKTTNDILGVKIHIRLNKGKMFLNPVELMGHVLI